MALLLAVFTGRSILLAAAEEKGECAAGDCDDGVYETDIDWEAWGRNVVKGEWDPVNRPPVPNDDPKRVRETNEFTLSEWWVGGVNVATYRFDQPDQIKPMPPEGAEPYELYENFDISDRITGEEAWWDLLKYRNVLKSPIGSFYYDKIALKRWVPTLGIAIPRSFALRYASELTKTGDPKDEVKAIAELVPSTGHCKLGSARTFIFCYVRRLTHPTHFRTSFSYHDSQMWPSHRIRVGPWVFGW